MKKILIIEDNDDIREGIAEMLDLAAYKTYTAKNGKIGVELAVENLPDLILCDIMMPELDGYGVLYLLQKNPKTIGIPFIFMTAKTERADMRKGMEMGADDYLTKPFDDVELFNAIESRLKKKNQRIDFESTNKDITSLIAELLDKGKVRTFAKGQNIYMEADEPNFLYYLKKGQVKSYKFFKDGRELSSGLYQEGDFFGYESLCAEMNYTENAATLSETELILVSKTDFMNNLLSHQAIAKMFLNLLSGNVREKGEQMLQLAYFSVRKRVAQALIQVAEKFTDTHLDTSLIKISRDDLAALVGTASETVSRMLSDFKDEKLIQKEGNAIRIISLDKLKNIKQ